MDNEVATGDYTVVCSAYAAVLDATCALRKVHEIPKHKDHIHLTQQSLHGLKYLSYLDHDGIKPCRGHARFSVLTVVGTYLLSQVCQYPGLL